ncbi:hypothetical protein [Endozoicomonas sp. YOMI1]|uniref:hypothetical protein n=1 Tax=Endozoicomonas sp. YOMI1 TaxID=2828739 RepID=UPI0021493637|nr:hypothetical protein [Endozoicomonas sp. YOMI1]
MDFLANDLSLHNQFNDLASFEESIDSLMLLKKQIEVSGRALQCNRDFINKEIMRGDLLPKVVQSLQRDKRQALLRWLTQVGPFWDAKSQHSDDDYLEVGDEIVTGSAIAEAAFLNLNGGDYRIISFQPSNWESTEIEVFLRNEGNDQTCIVLNYTEIDSIKAILSQHEKIESWKKLSELCISACPELHFSETCFEPLKGHPFVQRAANQILELCQIINKLKSCYDTEGNRTEKGQEIYQDHFTGQKAWFSDSSDTEKREFENQLTFKHPEKEGSTIFCPMHGKVNTPKYRVHFSWPVSNSEPLYIVYVGPKITKR